MSEHYTEVDLLETYYADAESAGVVGLHVSGCERCTMTLARLRIKMMTPGPASCTVDAKPDSFWERQRSGIMSRVAPRSATIRGKHRVSRIAAAAALSFLLGGAVGYETTRPSSVTRATVEAATPLLAGPGPADDRGADELVTISDPWESDELSDFHNVVSWQSWVGPQETAGGAS